MSALISKHMRNVVTPCFLCGQVMSRKVNSGMIAFRLGIMWTGYSGLVLSGTGRLEQRIGSHNCIENGFSWKLTGE